MLQHLQELGGRPVHDVEVYVSKSFHEVCDAQLLFKTLTPSLAQRMSKALWNVRCAVYARTPPLHKGQAPCTMPAPALARALCAPRPSECDSSCANTRAGALSATPCPGTRACHVEYGGPCAQRCCQARGQRSPSLSGTLAIAFARALPACLHASPAATCWS